MELDIPAKRAKWEILTFIAYIFCHTGNGCREWMWLCLNHVLVAEAGVGLSLPFSHCLGSRSEEANWTDLDRGRYKEEEFCDPDGHRWLRLGQAYAWSSI